MEKTQSSQMDERRHYILYAKNHYKKSGPTSIYMINDLKKIHARVYAIPEDLVSKTDIVHGMLELIWNTLHNSYDNFREFAEFISDLHPDECWKFGYFHEKESETYDLTVAIMYKSLSMFKFLEVSKCKNILDGDIGLGEADEALLPLSHETKKRREKEINKE